jgi:two-component system LytT family sensor kinase
MITVLVKLGVMASIASLLSRFDAFKRLLLKTELSLKEMLIFALLSGVLLSFGVAIRLLLNYAAADLSLSGTTLVGLSPDRCRRRSRFMVGAPRHKGELWRFLGVPHGVSGGSCATSAARKTSGASLIFLNLLRIGKTAIRDRVFDWQIAIFTATVALESLRIFIGSEAPNLVFHLSSENPWVLLSIYISTLAALGIPLKIWNNVRLERKLAGGVLVIRARLQAFRARSASLPLQPQYHRLRHRTDPEVARMLIPALEHPEKASPGADHFIPSRRSWSSSTLSRHRGPLRERQARGEKRSTTPLSNLTSSMIIQPLVKAVTRVGSGLEGGASSSVRGEGSEARSSRSKTTASASRRGRAPRAASGSGSPT